MIAIEAHILSQSLAAEAMRKQQANFLHLDGTKKRFTEYSGFQVSTKNGTFSLSHQVMPAGDADSYLKTTKGTLAELTEAIGATEDHKETVAKLTSIDSIMTDMS